MSFGILKKQTSHAALVGLGLALATGCTQSVPNQFKLLPAENSAPAAFQVGELKVETHAAPVDILWVVDNSDSMLTSQTKLKAGLATFANEYLLKPGTDIQVGVVTSDSYVANEAWQKWLVTELPAFKKTPLQFHTIEASEQKQWGPDYAKLSASELLSTKGMTSSSAKANLLAKFKHLVSVGTKGIYEEHEFASVEEFLADNEKGGSPNKLFRKGSQRVIVFISDEDDQSIAPENVGPEPRKLLYHGAYYTGKDKAQADKLLPAQFTIDCPAETYQGVPLAPMTLCMRPGLVEGVDRFKANLDSFFRELDGNPNGSPNYFVTAIVGKDASTIQGLRANTKEHNAETKQIVVTNEVGTRYLDLVNQAGNGSFAMDIGASDYAPILAKIGLEIENRSMTTKTKPQTSFDLDRAPDTRERLVVTANLASGRTIVLGASQFHVSGNKLEITDPAFISVLQPGDQIRVQYQPATVLPASQS
jgi:hypothetical protein